MTTTGLSTKIVPTGDDPIIIRRNFEALRFELNNVLLSTTLTTKGDILSYDTAATRKAVGSDGDLLFALSSEADGLQWRAPDTDDIAEGSRLYYTNERVDDRVAALIQDGTYITWTYNDGAGTLTPALGAHASTHTDGTDDIQNATAAQKGLATATQITKLDGIEAGATADQTDAEIRAAVEAATDSNVFTDADHTKLDGIDQIASKTSKLNATAAPTVNDDASDTSGNGVFAVGSRWIDVTNDKEYVCLDSTATAAVWTETTGSSSGDVSGPASSTDNAISRFDGTGGKTLQDSGVTIDDNDKIEGATDIVVSGTSPGLELEETDSAADNQRWLLTASGEKLDLNILNDAGSAAANVMRIQRTGTTVDSIAFDSVFYADQSEMEAASSTTKTVTPGQQHHHPGHPKAWVNFTGTGTIAINDSYGVSGITDHGTGEYTVTWSTAFSSANYGISATVSYVDSAASQSGINTLEASLPTTTAARFIVQIGSTGAQRDAERVYISASGDF